MVKDVKAFMKTGRKLPVDRPMAERIGDYKEVSILGSEDHSREQALRCMDCGIPFCQWGCPVSNVVPEWNELAYLGRWEQAVQLLHSTNVLPEITGRVCPAPCEYSCVLGINDDPVTIRLNELAIVEYGFKHGLIKPNPPQVRTGKKVAVVGSGPAGLACATQLNSAGHEVVVLERDDKIGGLLRYGIPDFKLEKKIIDRRVKVWKKEGIQFKTSVDVGRDLKAADLLAGYDAVCLTIGSRTARDLKIEGRELRGIHFAMDYLTQSNRRLAGAKITQDQLIDAQGKRVVVIGGGDTGSDCIGTAHRQGAASVTQLEVLPMPPEERTGQFPWPQYPLLLKNSTSHEEGGERMWSVNTREFIGEAGQLKKLSCVEVAFNSDLKTGRQVMEEVPGTEFEIEADMAVLAIGFVHPEHGGLVEDLKVELDSRGNIATDAHYRTSVDGIFAAGDAHRGQSLIVWAIREGRDAAHAIDHYLMGQLELEPAAATAQL